MSDRPAFDHLTRINQILYAFPDAAIATSVDMQIVGINPRASAMLQRDADDLIGSPITELVLKRHQNTLAELIANHTEALPDARERTTRDFPIRMRNGSSLTVEVSINRIPDADRELVVLALRDTTRYREIENELRTSEVLLAEAQRVARLGSWRWDVQNDEITWSSELYRLFGAKNDGRPLNFRSLLDMVHPADRERVRKVLTEAVQNQTSFEIEHRIIRPDGAVRLIFGQGAATLTDSGELLNMIGTAQDVTERKASEAQAFQLALEQAARQEAERTKERFQLLAEVSEALSSSLDYNTTLEKMLQLIIPSMADWCSVNALDENGDINRIVVAHRDPEKQKILELIRERGFLPHQDDAHPLNRALHDVKPALIPEVTDEMLRRMTRSQEHYELAKQIGPTSLMLVPLIARGRAFGVVSYGMSDSARHYNGDDLHLAVEVTHRAAVGIDNAYLYQEAQEAARVREEFVSLVSHELKTPLTVIKGYIQVMERYLEKPEWERERIRTSRARLSTQVSRLELLIADILDVSRMQRGRLDLNVVLDTDIVELARQVMERFDDAIERHPDHVMRVHAEKPVLGCWDPLRLDQVFSNLISNALKYSPDGGPIDITIQEQGGNALIEVTDYGVGIDLDEQTSLFQPFQRGAAAARGISGTGLGLYITRQIIDQHEGTIEVESTPGEFTTFRISLPCHANLAENSSLFDR